MGVWGDEDFFGRGQGFRDERRAQPHFRGADEYQRVRTALADPHNLPVDFNAFVQEVEKLDYYAKQRGIKVLRIYIELDLLRRFCAERRIEVTAKACAAYAQAMAARFERYTRDDA